ncbi:MAG: NfeD family protein [Acidimicrobiales bacterium]
MRRLASRSLLLAALGTLVASPALGQEQDGDGIVEVIEVSGWLDPVLVDFVEGAVERAEDEAAVALILQLDSPGAVVGHRRLDRLVERIKGADVTVGVWVGPSGARAGGGAAQLVAAADVAGLSPGSGVDRSARSTVDVTGREAATVGDFIVNLPGVETREVRQGDEIRREPVTATRFAQLSLTAQLMHTVASPAVAYLLFVVGLGLLIFELYTAGIGIAGMVGALCFVLGCYGLAVLPTRPLGIALLVLAMFGYAVDIQTGVPRAWTAIATAAFVVGSLIVYDGVSLSWITLLVAVVGIVLAMLAGMPAMVRSRFSTPTIGREWMVGAEGISRTAVDPDGVVAVRDAPWRARTNRATPIAAGDPVRVVSIDGLVLEVEPMDGAAVDYRDKARRGAAP